jgi:hypothetical protein
MKILKRLLGEKDQPPTLINQYEDNIDWEKIDLDKIKFILEQSEKCLNGALNNTDNLDKKAFTILAGSLSFVSALIVLILTKEFYFLIILIVGFIISSIYSMSALKTNEIYLIGSEPMEMLKLKHSGYDQKYLISCEAISNQMKIGRAIEVNKEKGDKINKATKVIQIALITGTVSVVISAIMSL